MRTLSRGRALVFGAAGIAAAALRPARADAPIALRIGATANDTFAEAYDANEIGIFKRNGIDATITTFPNGGAVMAGVTGGALDVGIATPMSLAVAIAHGAPLGLIAAGALFVADAPTTLLCVAKNSPIRDPKQLEGSAVALSTLNDTASVAFAQWLDRHGVDRAKVRRIELPFAEMGAALARNTVAAAVIAEPSLEVVKNDVRPFANFLETIGPRFLFSAWYAANDLRTKNPAAVKAFETSIYQTARWANGHREQSGAILARVAKIDPSYVRTMTRATYAEGYDPKLIQPALDVAYKEKILDRPMTAAAMLGTN